tara:strand:- start:1057 stop:1473 length:417 start_codon:yes stop_codon:yes gene_type:complete
MGIIIYSALLINSQNKIIEINQSDNKRKKAVKLQGFAISLLCLGLVMFIATINNRHPGILEGFRVFAQKGSEHPITKYAIVSVILALCIYILVDTHNQNMMLDVINYIIIGVIGLFMTLKGYEMVVLKAKYKVAETSV